MDKSAGSLRHRRAEAMLWAWGESDSTRHHHEHGHPSASPMHRMMREGVSGAGCARTTGGWRQRMRRKSDDSVELSPAATCYGSETRSRRMPEQTAPEADADALGTPYSVMRVLRGLSSNMQAVAYAKYVERRKDNADIAGFLGIDGLGRVKVGVLLSEIVDAVARQLIDQPAAGYQQSDTACAVIAS